MKSIVEKNSNLVTVGDRLVYIDAANFNIWTVTEVFDGGFEAQNDYETKDFYFNELQYGWDFTEATKRKHELQDRFQYAA